MDVPDQLSKQNLILEPHHGIVGSARKRLIKKLQQEARPDQQKNKNDRHAAQPPGQCEAEGAFLDRSRAKMKDQAVKKVSITFLVF